MRLLYVARVLHGGYYGCMTRETVGIRELKQNPSEIIAKAARGVHFDVLSNGKRVGVVIERDRAVRSQWVSTEAMAELTGVRADSTGWADEIRAQRQQDQDPVVDPWEVAHDHA